MKNKLTHILNIINSAFDVKFKIEDFENCIETSTPQETEMRKDFYYINLYYRPVSTKLRVTVIIDYIEEGFVNKQLTFKGDAGSIIVKNGLTDYGKRAIDKQKSLIANHSSDLAKMVDDYKAKERSDALNDVLFDSGIEDELCDNLFKTGYQRVLHSNPHRIFTTEYRKIRAVDMDCADTHSYIFCLDDNDQTLLALTMDLNKGFSIDGYYERYDWPCECCGSHHSYEYFSRKDYVKGKTFQEYRDDYYALGKNPHDIKLLEKELSNINVAFQDGTIKTLLEEELNIK